MEGERGRKRRGKRFPERSGDLLSRGRNISPTLFSRSRSRVLLPSPALFPTYFGMLAFDAGYALITLNRKAHAIAAWMILYTGAWAWISAMMNAAGVPLHPFHNFCLVALPLIGFVWLIVLLLVSEIRKQRQRRN
jgi:hypothetical protein